MPRAVDIPLIEKFEPLLRPARYKGAHGGRGSAKSHGFADLLIDTHLCDPGHRSVCIREYQASLEQSVKRLLDDKIDHYELDREFNSLQNRIETPGDGIIIFTGMQDHTADSIKSLEGFHTAWVEEAQSLSERSLKLLRPTIRTEGSEIWFSWNPRNPTDPVDKLLRGKRPPPDSVVVELTYKDNPFFPDVLRREMEFDRERDPELYAHVWLGEYEKHSSSRVFKNWRVQDLEPPPGTIFYQGGDWGFSVDPTVLVRVWQRDPKTIVIDSECYRIGVEIDDIPNFFDGLVCGCDYLSPRPCRRPELHASAREWDTRSDSARPETISYLQRNGYKKIVPATKGPNSVKEGVIFLQGYDIIVHSRCVHTIDELTMYSYIVDKQTGLVTPLLADKKNHVIDSLRYAAEPLRAVQGQEFVSW